MPRCVAQDCSGPCGCCSQARILTDSSESIASTTAGRIPSGEHDEHRAAPPGTTEGPHSENCFCLAACPVAAAAGACGILRISQESGACQHNHRLQRG